MHLIACLYLRTYLHIYTLFSLGNTNYYNMYSNYKLKCINCMGKKKLIRNVSNNHFKRVMLSSTHQLLIYFILYRRDCNHI